MSGASQITDQTGLNWWVIDSNGAGKVYSSDFDIRDLIYTRDSITSHQGGVWNITNITGTISLPTGAATSDKQLPNDHDVTVSNMIPAVETGLATSAKQLLDGHNVTANAGTNLNTSALALDTTLTSGIKLQDTSGSAQQINIHENLIGVTDENNLIGKGLVPNHSQLFKIGYNPEITTTEEDVWSGGGKYVFPTTAQQMEVVSTNNTQDVGTVIKGDATGNTVQSDADGTLTTLEDDDVDFTDATTVAVGDCLILDPHGSSPEFGTITAVDTHTLTVSGGFSRGGSGASRYYAVIDSSASTNTQAVTISYLDGDYAMHNEIVVLNGTTPVNTVNTDIFRVNSFAVICCGTNCVTLGNLSVRNTAGTIEYAHITAGYTIARQLIFTVPASYTGYITGCDVSASTPNDNKVQTARIIVRTNTIPNGTFRSSKAFYPKSEIVISNSNVVLNYSIPLRIVEKSDFVVSAQGFNGFDGPVVGVFRGYLELNE